MIIVLSPAKSLDYETVPHIERHSLPRFVDHSTELIETLRGFSPASIGSLMSISDPLARLNFQRFQDWTPTFTPSNAKQAVLAFNGDVYEGFDARSLAETDLDFAQRHVRILSGLYGVLRPLDLMQPYRLEMGTRLTNARGRDLYAFWGDRITESLNGEIGEREPLSRTLVNLASEEYFRSVRPKNLVAPVITPVFEEFKGGRFKVISFYAKRARGMMARYAVLNRIEHPNALKSFDVEGYTFSPEVSSEQTWVFRRRLTH